MWPLANFILKHVVTENVDRNTPETLSETFKGKLFLLNL